MNYQSVRYDRRIDIEHQTALPPPAAPSVQLQIIGATTPAWLITALKPVQLQAAGAAVPAWTITALKPMELPIAGTTVSAWIPVTAPPAEIEEDMIFYPQDNEPPTTAYATIDTRNSHPILDFDDTTAEAAIFTGVLMSSYAGGGLTVTAAYSATSATTGTIGWTIEIERIGDSQQDVDADSFATAQTITAATVPATSGHVDVQSVNISDGANMDSLAAGEQFRIRIKRNVASDTAVGDAELHWIMVKET